MATHRIVREEFDRISGRYARQYDGLGPIPHFHQTRLRLVRALLEQMPRGVILDVGSGPGILGDTVRRLGLRYVASDASIGMARECRKRGGTDPVIRAAVARAKALPFGGETFDVVMALGVLEYVESLDTAIAECRRVLRPGGRFIVSLLNKTSPYRFAIRVRERFSANPDPIPAAQFTRSYVHRLLSEGGFDVGGFTYFDFQLFTPSFAAEHPRFSTRVANVLAPLSNTPLRWLGSAMLIDAHRP